MKTFEEFFRHPRWKTTIKLLADFWNRRVVHSRSFYDERHDCSLHLFFQNIISICELRGQKTKYNVRTLFLIRLAAPFALVTGMNGNLLSSTMAFWNLVMRTTERSVFSNKTNVSLYLVWCWSVRYCERRKQRTKEEADLAQNVKNWSQIINRVERPFLLYPQNAGIWSNKQVTVACNRWLVWQLGPCANLAKSTVVCTAEKEMANLLKGSNERRRVQSGRKEQFTHWKRWAEQSISWKKVSSKTTRRRRTKVSNLT